MPGKIKKKEQVVSDMMIHTRFISTDVKYKGAWNWSQLDINSSIYHFCDGHTVHTFFDGEFSTSTGADKMSFGHVNVKQDSMQTRHKSIVQHVG